ncbi:MRG/MORF4L-binding protein isoform X1 [Onthophagus taurus]|nr:MRG/MORF4L-binding protein isoform X2 [Onthophagus taurus]
MAFICDKFIDNINKEVHSGKIWAHLETMYNLEALDESESLPFPNDEKEFCLPEAEYGTLKAKKEEKGDDKKNVKGRETPKNMKEMKKEEKTLVRTIKDIRERRDSRDSKDGKPLSAKKDNKKEVVEKGKIKLRNSIQNVKEENKSLKNIKEETPRAVKRPLRGSLKDDSNSNGKSSPVNVTPTSTKRRRVN